MSRHYRPPPGGPQGDVRTSHRSEQGAALIPLALTPVDAPLIILVDNINLRDTGVKDPAAPARSWAHWERADDIDKWHSILTLMREAWTGYGQNPSHMDDGTDANVTKGNTADGCVFNWAADIRAGLTASNKPTHIFIFPKIPVAESFTWITQITNNIERKAPEEDKGTDIVANTFNEKQRKVVSIAVDKAVTRRITDFIKSPSDGGGIDVKAAAEYIDTTIFDTAKSILGSQPRNSIFRKETIEQMQENNVKRRQQQRLASIAKQNQAIEDILADVAEIMVTRRRAAIMKLPAPTPPLAIVAKLLSVVGPYEAGNDELADPTAWSALLIGMQIKNAEESSKINSEGINCEESDAAKTRRLRSMAHSGRFKEAFKEITGAKPTPFGTWVDPAAAMNHARNNSKPILPDFDPEATLPPLTRKPQAASTSEQYDFLKDQTADDVLYNQRRLNGKSTATVVGYWPWILKHIQQSGACASFILDLWNECMRTNTFPWKVNEALLLWKGPAKGPATDAKAQRRILLASSPIPTLMSATEVKRAHDYLMLGPTPRMSRAQLGIARGVDTMRFQNWLLRAIFKDAMDNGHNIIATFYDFEEGFPTTHVRSVQRAAMENKGMTKPMAERFTVVHQEQVFYFRGMVAEPTAPPPECLVEQTMGLGQGKLQSPANYCTHVEPMHEEMQDRGVGYAVSPTQNHPTITVTATAYIDDSNTVAGGFGKTWEETKLLARQQGSITVEQGKARHYVANGTKCIAMAYHCEEDENGNRRPVPIEPGEVIIPILTRNGIQRVEVQDASTAAKHLGVLTSLNGDEGARTWDLTTHFRKQLAALTKSTLTDSQKRKGIQWFAIGSLRHQLAHAPLSNDWMQDIDSTWSIEMGRILGHIATASPHALLGPKVAAGLEEFTPSMRLAAQRAAFLIATTNVDCEAVQFIWPRFIEEQWRQLPPVTAGHDKMFFDLPLPAGPPNGTLPNWDLDDMEWLRELCVNMGLAIARVTVEQRSIFAMQLNAAVQDVKEGTAPKALMAYKTNYINDMVLTAIAKWKHDQFRVLALGSFAQIKGRQEAWCTGWWDYVEKHASPAVFKFVHKARLDQVITLQKLAMYKVVSSDICPLCATSPRGPQTDSTRHAIRSCPFYEQNRAKGGNVLWSYIHKAGSAALIKMLKQRTKRGDAEWETYFGEIPTYLIPKQEQLKQGTYRPDIMLVSQTKMQVVIFDFFVFWDTDLPRVIIDQVKPTKYKWIKEYLQGTPIKYHTEVHGMGMGALGTIPDSWLDVLTKFPINLSQDKARELAWACATATVQATFYAWSQRQSALRIAMGETSTGQRHGGAAQQSHRPQAPLSGARKRAIAKQKKPHGNPYAHKRPRR